MYNIPARSPASRSCGASEVTYTGSLDSTVSLYASAVGAIGPFVNLTIDKGTGTDPFPDCTGFTSEANVVHAGRSAASPRRTRTSATDRWPLPGAQTVWNTNNTLVYRFTLTLQNVPAASGLTSGDHSFTWEAQNV